jgi:hypothetical protein
MPDDLTLQTMVMNELALERSINAAHIGVAVKNGVVTLSGFVDGDAEWPSRCSFGLWPVRRSSAGQRNSSTRFG